MNQERLDHLITSYFDSDIKQTWNRYNDICNKASVPVKDYLHDITLYSGETLGCGIILQNLEREMKMILDVNPLLNQEVEEDLKVDLERDVAKYAKKMEFECTCSSNSFLQVTSRGKDANYWVFPDGSEGEGYMPAFPGLGDSDGLSLVICVQCGMIQGLDPDLFKKSIEQMMKENRTYN